MKSGFVLFKGGLDLHSGNNLFFGPGHCGFCRRSSGGRDCNEEPEHHSRVEEDLKIRGAKGRGHRRGRLCPGSRMCGYIGEGTPGANPNPNRSGRWGSPGGHMRGEPAGGKLVTPAMVHPGTAPWESPARRGMPWVSRRRGSRGRWSLGSEDAQPGKYTSCV
jgi:hypothetical protein